MNEKTKIKMWKHSYNSKQSKQKGLILLVELIGTALLVGGIIFPGAMGFSLPYQDLAGNLNHSFGSEGFWNFMNALFSTIIIKAFWVAALIFFLVIIFRRWSANFNPAVTLSEIAVGNDSYGFGFAKIFMQFIGAFAATYFAALVIIPNVSGQDIQEALTVGGYSLDGTRPVFMHFNYGNMTSVPSSFYATETLTSVQDSWYWFVQIVMEATLTFLLLLSVFAGGEKFSKNQRLLIITGTVWAILLIGIRFNTIALNPARLLAPAFVSYQYGLTDPLLFVWIYLIGELIAVAIFFGFANKRKNISIQSYEQAKIDYLNQILKAKSKR